MEVLDTTTDGQYRAILVLDTDADEPYNDGATPLIRTDGYRAEAVNAQADEYAEAYNRFSELPDNYEAFERYLRIFHGARNVKTYGPNRATNYQHITFDTDEWAEVVGCPEEHREDAADMDEYIAYLEGDVYVTQLERTEPGACGHDGCTDHTDWVVVDSIGGFYGDNEYTRQAYREYFEPFSD